MQLGQRLAQKPTVAVLGASAAGTSETTQYSRVVWSKCSCDSAQYPTVGVLGASVAGAKTTQYPTVGVLGASAVGTETRAIPYSRGGHLRHGQN